MFLLKKRKLQKAYNNLLRRYGMEKPTYARFDEKALRDLIEKISCANIQDGFQPNLNADVEIQKVKKRKKHIEENVQGLLDDHANKVEHDIKRLGLKLNHAVLVADFPTSSVNAQVCLVDGGALVLVNRGLMTFLYHATKVISLSIAFADFYGDGKMKYGSQKGNFSLSKEQIVGHWVDLIVNYLLCRKPVLVDKLILSTAKASALMELVTFSEYFVIAHEYGHIILGHLRSERIIRRRCLGGSLEFVAKDWEMEFEADRFALRLLYESVPRVIDHTDKSFLLQSVLGAPLLFFALDRIITRTWAEVEGLQQIPVIADHPPAHLRSDALMRYNTEAGITSNDLAYINGLLNLLKDMEENVINSLKEAL